MEIGRCHEQHPPIQTGYNDRCPRCHLPHHSLRLFRSGAGSLTGDLRPFTVPSLDHPRVCQAFAADQHGQELHAEKGAPEDKNEHVTADIVAALPQPPDSLARPRRHELGLAARPLEPPRELARPARDPEAAIDEGGAEEPLRHEEPPRRGSEVAERTPQLARGEDRPRGPIDPVEEEEGEEGEADPEPVDLDEVDVHQVPLQREVAGRAVRRVGLRQRVVGRPPGGRVDEGEERAEEKGGWVEGQQERFERCGQDGWWQRSWARRFGCCLPGRGHGRF